MISNLKSISVKLAKYTKILVITHLTNPLVLIMLHILYNVNLYTNENNDPS